MKFEDALLVTLLDGGQDEQMVPFALASKSRGAGGVVPPEYSTVDMRGD